MQIKIENYEAVLPILILLGKYFVILSLITLLAACAPMHKAPLVPDVESASNHDHGALALQYEELAEEMQAKVQAQKKVLKQKVFSSHFGKHRKNTRSRVKYKIRKYQQAAKEYSEKAAYHKTMATKQTAHKSAASSKPTDENIKMDKSEINLNKIID